MISQNNYRKNLMTAAFLLAAVFAISLMVGRYPISLGELFSLLTGQGAEETTTLVFFTLRLPRTIVAVMSGFSLSVAGSIYQSVFKNPLASPDIIGASSGANAGAAIAIAFFSASSGAIGLSAFVGGVVAVLFAMFLVEQSREKSSVNFVLSGIVVGSLATSIIMTIKFFADPERELAPLEFWAMGSLSAVTAQKIYGILFFFAVPMVLLFLLRWKINILSLSDEEARALGVNVDRVRYIVLICATLLVSSTLSVTGLISFIGLIAPHIARRLTNKNDFNTILFSGFIGAIILTVSDILARSLATSEIPISIITSFIGAPYLVYLMIKGGHHADTK